MQEIDARGLSCPQPVIMAKKALGENKKITVILDNQVAADNVARLGESLACRVSTSAKEENFYRVTIDCPADNSIDCAGEVLAAEKRIFFFKSDLLGSGTPELGKVLINGFIYALLETDPLPEKIIFMHAGVKIPTLNSDAIENLKQLQDKGVDLLICGTCLDYYGLKESLQVGRISNMYEIVDSLNKGKVVSV